MGGGKDIFKAVKDVGNVQIAINDPNIFHKCFNNIFLIKTPHLGTQEETCIEQLFDAVTLSTVVGGKTLNYAKEGDTSTEYGKHIFAEAVIRPNWKTINFDGFKPLLNAIRDAMTSYP
jgi:hypothetical protein